MFCWPCISIHLCNKTQLDALFILGLFHQSTSTCFRHMCSPSSGGILYIYNNWYVQYFLVDYLSAFHLNPANRHSTKNHSMYQLLYIYSIPPDDVLHICLKHVEVDWWNKLRINSTSSWVLLHGCIEMRGQQNINFKQTSLFVSGSTAPSGPWPPHSRGF
jgi:hypothetical protein